jgi:hypothetical protein
MFANLARALAGVAAVGLGAALAGCSSDAHVTIDGVSGVPLAQLDTSGKAPDTITLLGPDTVHVTGGDRLAITVDGDPAIKDQLRFTLKDGNLGIARKARVRPRRHRDHQRGRSAVAGDRADGLGHCPQRRPAWRRRQGGDRRLRKRG